ncbi:MAG: flagellar biosynthetic protein FliP [Alphaproteobacteria bacterium CG_4_10_14_0_8_um_filter_53_9]|nr:MAG: flagellar biosynthetic protein FliP [Alphaproteobacteria bacterium CG_4_10_14_0_8_um_filter_53_9]
MRLTSLFSLSFALLFIAFPALAQTTGPLNINLGNDMLEPERLFQIITLVTVLSLAPSLLLMVTSFTRIIIVFAFLRSAIGLQTTPPNSVLVSLSLFITAFIMAPTFQTAYTNGLAPYFDNQITSEQAFERATDPFRRFMAANVNPTDLELFTKLLPEADQPNPEDPAAKQAAETPLQALVPAYMISELKRAFEIGFLLFLPFLVIDLTVASILMSMGMMMLPPVTIALPFKIIFFVLVDGWHLLTQTLLNSFNPPL